jgi:restriction system protein
VDAQQAVGFLGSILSRGLEGRPFKMEMLCDSGIFPEPRPVPPTDQLPPPGPRRSDPLFDMVELDLKDFVPLLLLSGKQRREKTIEMMAEAAQAKYELACKNWQAAKEDIVLQNARTKALFEEELDAWWERAQAYQKRQQEENKKIDSFRLRYAQGQPDAVIEFLDAALSHAQYPEMFPMRWEMSFTAPTGALVVDYELPAPDSFPRLKSVKYDVLRDSFAQSYWGEPEVAQMYESAIYQTCLRSLHDAFAADEAEVIASVTFNGWVNFTDKSRDTPARACIISVQATRLAMQKANLAAADPKTSFGKLQGEAGARLADLSSVVPLLWLQRTEDHLIAANDALEAEYRSEFRELNN